MDIWVIHIWGVFRNNMVVNILANIPQYHISIGSTTKRGLLGHGVCVFTTLQGTTTLFPKGVVPVLSYTKYTYHFQLIHILADACILKWFHFSQSGGQEVFVVVFICSTVVSNEESDTTEWLNWTELKGLLTLLMAIGLLYEIACSDYLSFLLYCIVLLFLINLFLFIKYLGYKLTVGYVSCRYIYPLCVYHF